VSDLTWKTLIRDVKFTTSPIAPFSFPSVLHTGYIFDFIITRTVHSIAEKKRTSVIILKKCKLQQ